MADVVLSGAIRSNLLSIQNTAKLLDQTQLRLATGLKVNSAVDDATAFFTARGLTTRAADLDRLLDAMGQAVQTIRTADEGITALTSLIETAKATANQALETQIAASTGIASNVIGTTNVDFASATTSAVSTSTIVLQAGSTTFSQEASDLTTEALVSVINAEAEFTATLAAGVVTIGAVSGADLTISGSVASALGIAGTFTNGINRDSFVADFNNLRAQVDQLARDAVYKGINLLDGDDLTVFFNEAQTSSLTLTGVNLTTDQDLNITAATNTEFQTDAGIRAKIDVLDAATRTLRNQAATFGGNLGVVEIREDFTQKLINTLETGSANLTLADTNEEGANLLALQTRQQLGSVALSLAAQADQNVLRLF